MTMADLKVILSTAEVQRWRNDAAEIDAQIERLTNRKSKILEKLNAAEVLAPSLFIGHEGPRDGDTPKLIRERKGRVTWTSLIEEAVRNSVSGIQQKTLLADMRQGPYGDRLIESESGYYNGLGKLLKREILKKRGDFLFTAAQFDMYMEKVAAGDIPDVADNLNFGSETAASIMDAVKLHHPRGIESADAIRTVWAEREALGTAAPSKNSIYNTIARLVQQKHLSKKAGRLFLYEPKAKKQKEPIARPEADENILPLMRVVK